VRHALRHSRGVRDILPTPCLGSVLQVRGGLVKQYQVGKDFRPINSHSGGSLWGGFGRDARILNGLVDLPKARKQECSLRVLDPCASRDGFSSWRRPSSCRGGSPGSGGPRSGRPMRLGRRVTQVALRGHPLDGPAVTGPRGDFPHQPRVPGSPGRRHEWGRTEPRGFPRCNGSKCRRRYGIPCGSSNSGSRISPPSSCSAGGRRAWSSSGLLNRPKGRRGSGRLAGAP